jgi:hypothetical protein
MHADFKKIVTAANALFRGVELPQYRNSALVWSVSRNRPAEATVERSRLAVKADAAARVFEASCETLAWAVIDSGVDATHVAFRQPDPKSDPPRQPYPKAFDGGTNRARVKGSYPQGCGLSVILVHFRVEIGDEGTPKCKQAVCCFAKRLNTANR